eukprot:3720180-Ditylum_brightwellii.AAC.1
MVFLPLVVVLVLGVCLAAEQRFVQWLSLWDQVEVQLFHWEGFLKGQPLLQIPTFRNSSKGQNCK